MFNENIQIRMVHLDETEWKKKIQKEHFEKIIFVSGQRESSSSRGSKH